MALKKSKMSLKKKTCTAETGKLEKTLYEMYQNNTVIGWLTNFFFLNIFICTVFHFKTSPLLFLNKKFAFLNCPAKNASFFFTYILTVGP